MKIDTSAIAMSSSRNYESLEYTRIKSQETKWAQSGTLGLPKKDEVGKDKVESEDSLSRFANDTKKLLEDQQAQTQNAWDQQGKTQPTFLGSLNPVSQMSTGIPSVAELKEAQASIVRTMLELLNGHKSSKDSLGFNFLSSLSQSSSITINFSNSTSQSVNLGVGKWVKNVNATHFLSEKETTSFSSTGIAKTEDGRELAFNVDLQMSRSFMEYTNMNWEEELVMRDPLVINLSGSPASVSDQKFLFDIDSDGKEDSISRLNKGSGFLALDKNGDGKINDGSELFGAKSGNGFADLEAYDSDKNGWIDENDDIYSKLKVWVKDENGNDQLLDLKAADVGAIYLGNSKTDFTLKSQESGQVNGQIRRTGLYLKESTGAAGTVQQLDLSV